MFKSFLRCAKKFFYGIEAYVVGILIALAALLPVFRKPSDFIGVLTDLSVDVPLNNRAPSLVAAAAMLTIAVWESRRIYQAKVITTFAQLGLGILAPITVFIKIYLFFRDLSFRIIG